MKTLLIVLFFSITLAYAAKNDAAGFINPPEKSKFFSGSVNLAKDGAALVGPKKALVKVGECVKYLKNGEDFWTHYETEVAFVEAIGEKKIKLRPVQYVKVNYPDWTFAEEAKDIPFELQLQYEITYCPKQENKLSEEMAERFRKKQ